MECVCADCARDRLQGCRNPHACAVEAEHHDDLSLTPNRKEKNKKAHETKKGEILFDPTITRGRDLEHMKIEVYTDGACMNNGKKDARCGSGIWISDDHPQNKALKVSGPVQLNQVGELAAVITASESLPNYCHLTIITDSRYVIEGLTKHLGKWEDRGWIGIKNADMFKRAAYILKRRTAPTALSIPIEFDLQGAKLATLTQAIAYRGIRESRTAPNRPSTNRNHTNTGPTVPLQSDARHPNDRQSLVPHPRIRT